MATLGVSRGVSTCQPSVSDAARELSEGRVMKMLDWLYVLRPEVHGTSASCKESPGQGLGLEAGAGRGCWSPAVPAPTKVRDC